MSNDEPKFMKPGDDPELDRALNDLRFDSGLYGAGDYDMFGRRRALGRGAEGSETESRAPAPDLSPPAAPVALKAPREARPRRIKPAVVALAVLAAIAPVAIFAAVWRPPRDRETLGAAPSAAPVVTVAAASSTASAAKSAEPIESARPVTTVEPVPTVPAAPVRPRPRTTAEDPYDAAPAPAVTVTPSTVAPAPPPSPPAPAPTQEPKPPQTQIKF